MANNVSLADMLHIRPEDAPKIYAYVVTNMPDHEGYIKVGYTVREDAKERIKEQTHTVGAKYRTLFVETAMRSDGTCFTDKDVHRVLLRNGFRQLNEGEDRNEWFRCEEKDVRAAIVELRTGKTGDGSRCWDFMMRDEQRMAVEETIAYFKRAKVDEPGKPPKFLWNAKMRFGKTFATYQLAKKMGLKRVLILTFKPAVEAAWQEDISCHKDFDGWQFVSSNEANYEASRIDEQYEECDKERPIVVFGSFQGMLRVNGEGGIMAKNEFIHTTNWDLVVLDEYHYGAWREKASKLFERFDEEGEGLDVEAYSENEAGNAINESWLPITTNYYLYLSGTPFRAINSGEFLEDQIFNWTYADEQEAKEKWDDRNGKNPYVALPKMVMLTYKIPDSITEVAVREGFDGFDINEFFRAKEKIKGDVSSAEFVYEDYVQKWLDMIQGKYMAVDGMKLGKERPPMPFSDGTLLNVLAHTLWYLPDVASCFAMRNLLGKSQNRAGFGGYGVVVCAGKDAGTGLAALPPVLRAMGDDPLKSRTITLSCGKLTTGVTVRPWTGVFMLRNLQSPESYFQTAFRVQSPWVVRDNDGNDVILKKECYIFDFALERALKQIADYSCNLSIGEGNPEQKVAEFINFLPVLAFDGASMNRIDAQDILDITYAGTSATLLAKRWQTALLVHVDNDTLKRLLANEGAMEALKQIEGFRALSDNITQIINRSEKIKKLRSEKDGEKAQSKKEISKEEKEVKSLRREVQENLLKLATRIPAFMYLTDYRERCLKDVITEIEPELFRKVTGLSVKDFETLCSIGLFDSVKMNQGIFGFRKYEDSSLSYTGIDMHEGKDVGGWDTVLRKEEYEALFSKQQTTIACTDEG